MSVMSDMEQIRPIKSPKRRTPRMITRTCKGLFDLAENKTLKVSERLNAYSKLLRGLELFCVVNNLAPGRISKERQSKKPEKAGLDAILRQVNAA